MDLPYEPKKLETWIQEIRLLVSLEKVSLKKHCILRMRQRRISIDEFKEAMSHAKIVEYYQDDYPLPSALILGFTALGRPLHAVAALDQNGEMLWIITLYEPTIELWDDQFKNRK
jgi:hypothetical protein